MRIAQIAPLWTPTPPRTYGGTEFIVHHLTEELIRRGHKVTLFASGDSKTTGKLIASWPQALWRAKLNSPHAVYSLHFRKVLAMQENFDVIHDHTDFYLSAYTPFIKKPVITTIHRPITEEVEILLRYFPRVRYVAISQDQSNSAPLIHFAQTIYNGIPLEEYPFQETPGDYVVWLSKIETQKGILEAIEAAKRAKEKLVICGNVIPEKWRFFKFEVAPLIDGKRIVYVGEVDFAKKVRILSKAKALLYPVQRREPFGLAMIEAMACGTPVIAFPNGAVPEIVQHGKTGFLVKSIPEMAAAVHKIERINRADCRKYIEEHFSLARMVDAYEKLYNEAVSAHQ